jgi:hypothetical protein
MINPVVSTICVCVCIKYTQIHRYSLFLAIHLSIIYLSICLSIYIRQFQISKYKKHEDVLFQNPA